MNLGDSSEVDAAVIALLQNDSQLAGWPVYWGNAAAGVTRFISIVHIDHSDLYSMGAGIVWEAFDYMIEAVEQGSSGVNVKAAAKRIREVLQDAALQPNGYQKRIVCQRIHYVRVPEPPDISGQYWQRRGGRYEIKVIPLPI